MGKLPLTLSEHARAELQRAGEFDRDIAFATAIMAAVCVVDAFVISEQLAPGEIAGPLSLLLRHGTLTPLSDEPAEWDDRSGPTGRAIWQNRRNPAAFSHDGGLTYFLVTEKRRDTQSDPPMYRSVPAERPRVRHLDEKRR
jgi:hypothetical protein